MQNYCTVRQAPFASFFRGMHILSYFRAPNESMQVRWLGAAERFFAFHRRAHGYAATLAEVSKRTHIRCGGILALPTGSRRSVNEAIHQHRVHHLKNPFALVTVNNQPVSLASLPPCEVSLNDEARTFTIPRYLGREVRVSCTNSTHTHRLRTRYKDHNFHSHATTVMGSM